MSQFELKVWSLEKELFGGQVKSLKCKAIDGWVEIEPKHVPYINELQEGKIELILPDGTIKHFDSPSGFVKVDREAVHVFINPKQ
ncbi:hypothetical protein HZC34_04375 [Candidatus Saganbacteria bacterium]|nr:hypothetical protein [Candidatus Saganbacteria bacterium]